jgi:methyl-accepting chemotaxis protein
MLIQQSATEVGNGSKLVADAADKLATMLEGVRGNNTALVEMAGASRSQASSISEVSAAVRQMDEMTQHNAALVEEINASIEQTESQASELDRIVDVFTIDEHRASRGAAARPAVSVNKPTASASKPASRRAAAASYLTQGNAAISKDWAEF